MDADDHPAELNPIFLFAVSQPSILIVGFRKNERHALTKKRSVKQRHGRATRERIDITLSVTKPIKQALQSSCIRR